MIKKCNFKGDNGWCLLCYNLSVVTDEKVIHHMKICPNEKNCILFQIYQRLGKDWGWEERYGNMAKGVKECTCTQCGEKGHFNFSSGYCDECYEKEFHNAGHMEVYK